MRLKYLIADDDAACRRMLIQIIEESRLGDVLDAAENGREAEHKVMELKPDIVLIDLLMPDQDGIETMRRLKEKGFQGRFVMISQIENKKMVEDAYVSGVNFYIHKPINRIEVTTVLRQIRDSYKIESSLQTIKNQLASLEMEPSPMVQTQKSESFQQIVHEILSDLGILGEAGSHDLVRVMEYLLQRKIENGDEFPTIKEIYLGVLSTQGMGEEQIRKETKAMEQRIRRVIDHAISHLASLGLTDFSHPKFEHYAPRFFDFSEVRKKMRVLEEGDGDGRFRVKINVKKFIQILYWESLQKYNLRSS